MSRKRRNRVHRQQPVQGQVVPQRSLAKVFEDYDPVSVTENYIVVQERVPNALKLAQSYVDVDYRELGGTGYTLYGQIQDNEYNPTLRGYQGLKKFDEMRRSDAQVKASLRLLKTPVLAGRWHVQPASQSVRDRNTAEFVRRCLWEFMSISFTEILTQALLMLDFGYFMFEKVFEPRIVDGEPRVVWKKLAPRHPLDVEQWNFDTHGGPSSVTMLSYDPLNNPEVVIPIEKLLVFTNEKEAGVITGISALRSAYKHWYFKDNLYKIDAIQKERHGIGVPIIKLPPNFSQRDAQLADEIGRNLRVNEKAHVVLPPMWELEFAKLEGQPVNSIESIEHHNRMISSNILGTLIERTGTGSGSDQGDHEVFMKAARYVADQVRDVFNKYAIPQLIDYNFSRVGYPQLLVRRVGETTDWRTLSFAVRNFVGADILHSDDKMEEWVRDEMDLPLKDDETDRVEAERRREERLAQKEMDNQFKIKQQQQAQSNAGQVQGGNPKSSSTGKPTPATANTGSKRVGGPSNNSA